MEASTSDEHLSVSKLKEKFNNLEVKPGAQEVKSGSFQQTRGREISFIKIKIFGYRENWAGCRNPLQLTAGLSG